MRVGTVASLLACLGLGSAVTIDPSDFDENQIVTRDVCVIGGGAGGTYAAVRLRQMNQTVAVVEQNGRLGGHTHTYFDPTNGTYVDYGVLLYSNLDVVRDFYGHFNIPLATVPPGGPEQPQRIDFRSGTPVEELPGNATEALLRYATQIQQHPYLSVGLNLPDPVPEDLLLPFGEFIEKYDIDAAVDLIFLYVQGVGEFLSLPTIYVMKYFSVEVLQGIQNGFLQNANGNNGALYVAAAEQLASDIFFNSTVAAMDRDSNPEWIYVEVQTPDGRELIQTRQVISATPPTLDNLRGFDLDDRERSVFGQFSGSYYWTTLARIDGLASGAGIVNRANETEYHLQPLPGIYIITSTAVPGLWNILYGSENAMSEEEVKNEISGAVQRLNGSAPEFVVFENHSPFELRVPSDAIADGFYREVNALQGRRRTFYTGAAFEAHDSGRIWRFTESLLQRMQGKE